MKPLLIFLNAFTIFFMVTAHTESTTDDDDSSSSDSTESYAYSTEPNLISPGPAKSTFCTRTTLVITNVTDFEYQWSFSGIADYFTNMDQTEFRQSAFSVNNTDLKLNEEELPGNWSLFISKPENEGMFSLEMVFKSRKPTCHLKLSPELQVSHPLFQVNDAKPEFVRRQVVHPMTMDMGHNYNYNMMMGSTTPSYIQPNSNFSQQPQMHGHHNHNNSHNTLFTTTFQWKLHLLPSSLPNSTFQDDYANDNDYDEDLDLDFHVVASHDRVETQQLSGKACNKKDRKHRNKDGRMRNGMQKNNRMA